MRYTSGPRPGLPVCVVLVVSEEVARPGPSVAVEVLARGPRAAERLVIWDYLGNHSKAIPLYVLNDQGQQFVLSLSDTRGKAAFAIVVPCSKFGGFSQIIETNLTQKSF